MVVIHVMCQLLAKENYVYNMFTIYWDIVELNVRLKL